VLAALGFGLGVRNAWTLLTLAFGGYAAQVTLGELSLPVRQRMKSGGQSLLQALAEVQHRGRRRTGLLCGARRCRDHDRGDRGQQHDGHAQGVQLAKGQSVEVGRYTLTFLRPPRK